MALSFYLDDFAAKGHYAYANGSVYNASKYAVQAFTTAARHDLAATPVKNIILLFVCLSVCLSVRLSLITLTDLLRDPNSIKTDPDFQPIQYLLRKARKRAFQRVELNSTNIVLTKCSI